MESTEVQRLARVFGLTPAQVIQAGIDTLKEQAAAVEASLAEAVDRSRQEAQIERVMGLPAGTLSDQRIAALKARRT